MKTLKILSICFFLFISSQTYSQSDYTVIKVLGKIFLKKNDKNLVIGLVFSEKDKLIFGTPKSSAVVINPNKGRLILSENSESKRGYNFLPAMSNISPRGEITSFRNLKELFSAAPLVILDTFMIDIAINEFIKNKADRLYIVHENMQDTMMIDISENKIILTRDIVKDIFWEKNKKNKHKIIYTDGSTVIFKNNIQFVFPNKQRLKKEAEIIFNELQNESLSLRIFEVTCHINEFYGFIDDDNVRSWLNVNLDF